MEDLTEKISKKLGLTITVSIFFILFLKALMSTFNLEQADKFYIQFSVVVVLYIFDFVVFDSISQKISKRKKHLNFLDSLVNTNLILFGFFITYIVSTEGIHKLVGFFIWFVPKDFLVAAISEFFKILLHFIGWVIPLFILIYLNLISRK